MEVPRESPVGVFLYIYILLPIDTNTRDAGGGGGGLDDGEKDRYNVHPDFMGGGGAGVAPTKATQKRGKKEETYLRFAFLIKVLPNKHGSQRVDHQIFAVNDARPPARFGRGLPVQDPPVVLGVFPYPHAQ